MPFFKVTNKDILINFTRSIRKKGLSFTNADLLLLSAKVDIIELNSIFSDNHLLELLRKLLLILHHDTFKRVKSDIHLKTLIFNAVDFSLYSYGENSCSNVLANLDIFDCLSMEEIQIIFLVKHKAPARKLLTDIDNNSSLLRLKSIGMIDSIDNTSFQLRPKITLSQRAEEFYEFLIPLPN